MKKILYNNVIENYKNSENRGITLIALVITIIILIILAGVVISLSIGDNGILKKAGEAKEDYMIESIREKVELEIANLEMERLDLNQSLTIEEALQEMIENGTFDSIDKNLGIGNIGEYEVKLKYSENNKVVIEYIQKASGIKISYTLNPVGYTNQNNVSILFKVQGKIASIMKPDGVIVNSDEREIDYKVTANGKYIFIVEKEDGSKIEKEVTVDTIDTLAPKDFVPQVEEYKSNGFIIAKNAEDADATDISACSGIEKYEYYIKKNGETQYTKHDTNEIVGLTTGTYYIYSIAYDRAGNSTKSSEIEAKISMKMINTSGGRIHTFSIDEKGNLWAWGGNEYGQLGDGTTTNKTTPILIREGTKFKKIETKNLHTLGIDEEGNLWAWGWNYYGQLGDGTTTNRTTPVLIKNGTKFKEISVGETHSSAIDEQGNLWTWGYNYYGQIGDGTTTTRKTPVLIKNGTKFKKIALGNSNFSLAIDEEGNLWTWGRNRYGEIGDGTTTQRNSPTLIKEGTKFKEVSTGDTHSLAIDEEGNLWTWGYNNNGEIGDGTTTQRKTPVLIKSGTKFKEVSAGDTHSLAIDEEGNLWTWGYNNNGQLGDGTTTDKKTPVLIKSGTKFKEVSAGDTHSLAIDENGYLWLWGEGGKGQLGDGMATYRLTPSML